MKTIILIFSILVFVSTICQGHASSRESDAMAKFLRHAYCDILGVVRSESEGKEKEFFNQHLSDLVSGRKTPSDVIGCK